MAQRGLFWPVFFLFYNCNQLAYSMLYVIVKISIFLSAYFYVLVKIRVMIGLRGAYQKT